MGEDLGPAFRKYSKLSKIMAINIAGLGETGHFIKWSDEVLELVRRRGRAWLNRESQTELYARLKSRALSSLYPTTKPFGIQHFAFSFLCMFMGCTLAVAAFVVEFLVKQFNQLAFTYCKYYVYGFLRSAELI